MKHSGGQRSACMLLDYIARMNRDDTVLRSSFKTTLVILDGRPTRISQKNCGLSGASKSQNDNINLESIKTKHTIAGREGQPSTKTTWIRKAFASICRSLYVRGKIRAMWMSFNV